MMAWKDFAMAEDPDWFAGNHEHQVPIFVFTDKAPKKHTNEYDIHRHCRDARLLTISEETSDILRLLTAHLALK